MDPSTELASEPYRAALLDSRKLPEQLEPPDSVADTNSATDYDGPSKSSREGLPVGIAAFLGEYAPGAGMNGDASSRQASMVVHVLNAQMY